jgi:hypothetical protein
MLYKEIVADCSEPQKKILYLQSVCRMWKFWMRTKKKQALNFKGKNMSKTDN